VIMGRIKIISVSVLVTLAVLILPGSGFAQQTLTATGHAGSSRLLQKFFPDEERLRIQEIESNQILENSKFKVKGLSTLKNKNDQVCSLPNSLVKEIASYQNVTDRIIHEMVRGTFQRRTYEDLSYFVDKFGSRLSGTQNLENSIDFMMKKMKQDGLDNVHGEDVIVPHWNRYER